MSGIVGIVHREPDRVDTRLLGEMTASLQFRGPDGQRTWSDRHVGLGHALLRTIDDGATDAQPLSVDGQVWIAADARIDGRTALVEALRATRYPPDEPVTDAELVLRAYLAWGDACVGRLIGDFAFVIWDGRTERLWCARDQLGVKPFYYAAIDRDRGLVFGNTLASVRMHPDVPSTLNEQAIADFLLFGYNMERETTSFSAVRRLPAAHTLEWTRRGTWVTRYWDVPLDRPLELRDPNEYVERYRELLRTAVSDRLRTNRVAISLSGGIDSSSVAATAQAVLSSAGRPFELHGWTVVFDSVIKDEERRYSGLVADALRIPVTYQVGDTYRPFEFRNHRAFTPSEPRSLAAAARRVDRLQQISEQSRVLLTGQGGDVIFRPSASHLSHVARRGAFVGLAVQTWGHVRQYGRLPRLGLRTRLRHWMRASNVNPAFPTWLEPAFVDRLKLRERWTDILHRRAPLVRHHRPEAVALVTGSQWQRLFDVYDAESTGFPIDYRHPLFDLRILSFALSLPTMPWCVDKALAREAMRGLLPEAVRCRPKTPLAGNPFDALSKDSGAEWLLSAPRSPLLERFVRLQSDFNRSNAIGYRPFYLNVWLQSLHAAVDVLPHPQEDTQHELRRHTS